MVKLVSPVVQSSPVIVDGRHSLASKRQDCSDVQDRHHCGALTLQQQASCHLATTGSCHNRQLATTGSLQLPHTGQTSCMLWQASCTVVASCLLWQAACCGKLWHAACCMACVFYDMWQTACYVWFVAGIGTSSMGSGELLWKVC